MLSKQQQIVQTYTDDFATGDVAQIVSCVNDDLVWDFNGQKTPVRYQARAPSQWTSARPNNFESFRG